MRGRFVVVVAGALALVSVACFPPQNPGTTTTTTSTATTGPTPIEVTDTGDGGDGVCDETCTLRDAIVQAESSSGPSVVELPPGRFVVGSPPAGARGRAAGLATAIGPDGEAFGVTEPLTISGAGAGVTTIDFSGDSFRVGWRTTADLTLTELAVTGLSAAGGPAERTVVEGAFATSGGLVRFDRTAISDVAPDSTVDEPAAGSLVDVPRDEPGSPFAVEVVDSTVTDLGRFQVQADETTDGMSAALVRNAGGTLLVDGLDLADASPLRLGRCGTSLPTEFPTSLTAPELCPSSAVVWNSRIANSGGPAIRPESGAPGALVSSCQRDGIVAVDAKVRIGFTHVDPGAVPPACGSLPLRPSPSVALGETNAVMAAGTIDLEIADSELTVPSDGTMSAAVVVAPRSAPVMGLLRIDRSTLAGGMFGLTASVGPLTVTMYESTVSGSYASVMLPHFVTGAIGHVTLSGPNSYQLMTAPPEGVDPGPGVNIRASILQGTCNNPAPMILSSSGANVVGNCPGFPGLPAQDVVGVDPQLGALADNGGPTRTMLPSATSPALDNHWCLGIDQRGATRPVGDDCDAGAVELGGEPSALTGAPPYASAPAAPAVGPQTPPPPPPPPTSTTSGPPTTVQPTTTSTEAPAG